IGSVGSTSVGVGTSSGANGAGRTVPARKTRESAGPGLAAGAATVGGGVRKGRSAADVPGARGAGTWARAGTVQAQATAIVAKADFMGDPPSCRVREADEHRRAERPGGRRRGL